MNSKQGSGKRPLQERNFKLLSITINEDQLPQVSRQSVAALKNVFGHNIKKYSGTFHHNQDCLLVAQQQEQPHLLYRLSARWEFGGLSVRAGELCVRVAIGHNLYNCITPPCQNLPQS